MTKNQNTKKALLASLLSMALCVAVLIGSTMAWFTDLATTGNNRIVAGNLDIGLQWKTEVDGVYDYTDLSDDAPLFDRDIQWEPGQVHYKELKVQNLGDVAVKFSVNISDWDGNMVLEANEDGTYTATERMLFEVIWFAVYEGTFEELVEAVNAEIGTSYTTDDREVVMEALELELMTRHEALIDTDPNEGALFEGTLESESEAEFTLIVYWVCGVADDDIYFEGDDNAYNLINGRVASKFTNADVMEADDYEEYMSQAFGEEDVDPDGLYMTFDIVVIATQAPSEQDNFGNDYDEDIRFNPFFFPPVVE